MTIKARALSALRWTATAQALSKLVTWSITIYVIRLLEPKDYGVMAMAMAAVEFAAIFSNFGLNSALIQRRKPDDMIVAKIYGAIILSSLTLFVLIQLAAGPYAAFYGNPIVADILRVVAFGLLIGAASSVPTTLLVREIDFKATSIVTVARQLVGAGVVLTMAIAGFGVWSLVGGYLVSQAFGTAAILLLTRFRLKPNFNFTGIAGELRFGVNMVGKNLVSIFNRQIDVVLIGRLVGAEALGAYSVAGDLARLPTRFLLRPVAVVVFPTIARLKEEGEERVRSLFPQMIAASLLVLLPLCWGAATVADPLVQVVLGEKWATAAPILAILGIVVPIRASFRLVQMTLDGLGRPDVGLRNLITIAVCLPPGLAIGALGGLPGVALGWSVAQLLALSINLRRSLPIIGVGAGSLLRGAAPALLAGAIMVAGVFAVDAWLVADLPPIERLLALTAAGGCIYLAVSFAINRQLMAEMVQLLAKPSAA